MKTDITALTWPELTDQSDLALPVRSDQLDLT